MVGDINSNSQSSSKSSIISVESSDVDFSVDIDSDARPWGCYLRQEGYCIHRNLDIYGPVIWLLGKKAS